MRHVISRLRVCRRRRLRAAYRERDVRQYAYGHRRGAPVPVALVNVIGHLIVSNTPTVFPFVHEASCGPRLYPGIDIMARSKTARRLGTTLWSENNTYPQMPGVSRHDMPKRHRTWHTMGHMSDNTTQRKALQQLESEPSEERIAYYRKPFMVLWAAIQEASSELQDDYTLSPELSQLWVGEQIRQVSDFRQRIGSRKSPWRIEASQNRMWHVRPTQVPTTSYVASLDSRLMRHTTAHSLTTCSIRCSSSEKFLRKQKALGKPRAKKLLRLGLNQ